MVIGHSHIIELFYYYAFMHYRKLQVASTLVHRISFINYLMSGIAKLIIEELFSAVHENNKDFAVAHLIGGFVKMNLQIFVKIERKCF